MSRGRRGGQHNAGAATVAKAGSIAEGDAQTLIGTIADANSNRLPDVDLYYMLYRKHPWVRAVVDVIANAVSQEGFTIVSADGEEAKDLTNDQRVKDINRFFSLVFVGNTTRAAMMALAGDLEVSGWGYLRRKRAGSLLVGLERLDPRLVKPKFNDDRTEIVAWVIKKDAANLNSIPTSKTGAEEIPAQDVVFFKFPGGDALLGPGSKLESLDLTLAVDLNIRKLRNASFRNGAPVGTIMANKGANEDQVRAAVKQIRGRRGSERAYEPLVLTGDWTVTQTMQTGKQDIDFVKGTGITREEVCVAYSFPPGKLQFSDGALGSSGKGEDDNTFQQECVLPLEELIFEILTMEIVHGDFKGQYDDLKLVPKRRDSLRLDRIEAALGVVKCGGTGNEARDLIGLPKIDDPEMDKPLFISHTANTVDDDAGVTPAQQPGVASPGGIPGSGDAGDAAAVAGEVGQAAKKGKRQGVAWY